MARILLTAILWLQLCGQLPAQWAKQANLPAGGRDGALLFTVNNKIYVGGGVGYKDLWEYDPVAKTWAKKADIPGVTTDRSFGVAFSINNKGYVGIGADGGFTSSILNKDLWEYDPVANTWTQKADFPGVARDGCCSFVVNDKAYIGGGYDGHGLLADFYEYTPVTDTWAQKADYPLVGIIFPFSFSIGDKGYSSCGQASAETSDTYEYDPALDIWTAKAAFPGAVRQAGVAFVLNDKAYCGLGMTGYTTCYKDFYSYDPSTDTWSLAENFSASARAWPSAATANGKAYIGLGWDFVSAASNDWWEFSLTASGIGESVNEQQPFCYPNPSDGLLHIRSDQRDGHSTYTITTMLGQIIDKNTLPSEGIIRLDGMNGLYLLEITTEKAMTRTMIQVHTAK